MKNKQTKTKFLKASMATLAVLTGATSVTTLTSMLPVYAENTKTSVAQNLINGTTSWKYLDNNVDPGTIENRYAWTANDFDDSAWKEATGKFGHKNGVLTDLGGGNIPTVLLQNKIENTSDAVPTYFFRTTVNVTSLQDIETLKGTVLYDDAVIVYINGTRIAAFDEPEGGYSSNMQYGGSNASDPKTGEITLSKEALNEVLKVGENTISVEVHQGRASSSDVYFEFKNLELDNKEVELEQKALNLTVGKDETMMNLTWYANSENGEVQFAKASAMSNGAFPTNYSKVTAKSNLSNDGLFVSHQATLTNLSENTKYVYRVVNEDKISDLYYFTTEDFDGNFNFIFAGDPQIGAGGNATTDSEGWKKTLNYSINKFQPNFILSGGDQVNTSTNENEYAGYLDQGTMTSVPQSTSIGNHDSSSASYSQHFNLPNLSNKGKTTAGGDYYYVYNNTLFMNINTNNTSTAEHQEFLKEAINANKDVRWKVVTFHHSIYSVASHAVESGILNLRNNLVPVFDELGVDVVLMGHDHVYVRSHIMKDLKVVTDTSSLDSVTDPQGILYLTANSASGSKYYDIKSSINMDFVAKKDQSKQRSISNIEVSANEFKITTYLNTNGDNWTQLDQFSVKKTAVANEEELTLKPSGDSNVNANVTGEAGTIPTGATFDAKEIKTGTLFNQVKSLSKDKQFKIYDFLLKKDNIIVDPLGNIQMSVDIPEGYNVKDILLYKVKTNVTKTRSANVALEKVDFKIKDGKIVFTTNELGQYVFMNNIVEDDGITDNTTPDKKPDQGGNNQTDKPTIDDTNKDTSDKKDDSTNKEGSVKTGDQSEIIAYGVLALATVSCGYVVSRKKKIEE